MFLFFKIEIYNYFNYSKLNNNKIALKKHFRPLNFFFASKFLPLIVMPLGIAIFSLINFIFSKSKKSLFFSLFCLLFFSNGISSGLLWQMVEKPWQRLKPFDLPKVDAIVVLSGGGIKFFSKNPEVLEWNDPDRFNAGLELYNEGKSSKLLFTGGINPFNRNLLPEGELYKREAKRMGIPKENIIVSKPVKNTSEEAIAIENYLNDELNITRPKIILVTSAYHMNRAIKIFKKRNIIIIPYPVDFNSVEINRNFFNNPLNWFPDSKYLSSSSIALREFLGRFIYNFIF